MTLAEHISELRGLVDELEEGGFDEGVMKKIAHGLKMVFGKLRKVGGSPKKHGGDAQAHKDHFSASHSDLKKQIHALKHRVRVAYPD